MAGWFFLLPITLVVVYMVKVKHQIQIPFVISGTNDLISDLSRCMLWAIEQGAWA
jgi:hypothetical protein